MPDILSPEPPPEIEIELPQELADLKDLAVNARDFEEAHGGSAGEADFVYEAFEALCVYGHYVSRARECKTWNDWAKELMDVYGIPFTGNRATDIAKYVAGLENKIENMSWSSEGQ